MNKHFFGAIATLVGCIVGAGVLGMPYVIAQAGFLTGMLTIIFLGTIVLLVYLYLGEITLRTKGFHQMTGYCEMYLGKWGKYLMMVSMIFGTYSALIAYILGEGASMQAIFGGSMLVYQIIYTLIMSLLIYRGLRAVEASEIWLDLGIILVIFIISLVSVPYIRPANLNQFDVHKTLVPFGVVLFAFMGLVAVPEVREILVKKERMMKSVIMAGLLIPLFLYLFFSFTVVGVIGKPGFDALGENERIATIALGKYIGPKMVVFGNIFAIFAMASSFLALGLALKEMFEYDFKVKPRLSFLLTILPPFIIALFSGATFIGTIALSGVIAGGLDILLVMLMVSKAKKIGKRKPEYTIFFNSIIKYLLIGICIIGAGYHFYNAIV